MEAKKMAMAGQRLEITSLLSSLVEELSSNFSVLFVSVIEFTKITQRLSTVGVCFSVFFSSNTPWDMGVNVIAFACSVL
ncbi:hypothetical protein HanXRQr2_Chr03g0119951 [Helianthus annuus]|uniref:Uncharacterized protein n=1 Tax=Helianthus annuus TaxID=4232 RepID=A0A251V7Y1_HELAN|nr:hypothetical protein HanXRQr2_Chr03g0119951 [Helianthus annuus]KAJ0944414.1 hypothetical protein HanPSC8_Chr03g0116481 [Helianthus annuus]